MCPPAVASQRTVVLACWTKLNNGKPHRLPERIGTQRLRLGQQCASQEHDICAPTGGTFVPRTLKLCDSVNQKGIE